VIMVTTDALVRLWQHYDDQANTPFTGAKRARKLADRMDVVLKSPNSRRILRALPKDATDAVDVIEHMSDVEFDGFIHGVITKYDIGGETTGKAGYVEPPESIAETQALSCEQEYEPTYSVIKEFQRRENRWAVFVRRKDFDGPITDKLVGMYAYESQADAVIKALLYLDEKTLKEMWMYL
jgi:hypothetical protein